MTSDFNKKLEDVLDELGQAYHNNYPDKKAHKKATTAIKNLMIELITNTEPHYGCGENDVEVVAGDDPKDLCCECYPHESCEISPAIMYQTHLFNFAVDSKYPPRFT